MALRPRAYGHEYRGYTRVAVRRWIKDPEQRVVVPSHLANMTPKAYAKALRDAEKHRAAVKDNPPRPEQLDSGFFEPEIYTVRRSKNKSGYLQRHPDMMEPTMNGQNRSNRSKNEPEPVVSADNLVVKIEE